MFTQKNQKTHRHANPSLQNATECLLNARCCSPNNTFSVIARPRGVICVVEVEIAVCPQDLSAGSIFAMGRVFVEHLNGQAYSCKYCGTHLAKVDELLSKQFHSKNGPAWLFGHVVNIVPGPKEERLMTTGMHVVSDISCTKCFTPVGWKYEDAYEESQKYKVGRFILERAHVVETNTRRPSVMRLDSSYQDEHSSDLDDHYF